MTDPNSPAAAEAIERAVAAVETATTEAAEVSQAADPAEAKVAAKAPKGRKAKATPAPEPKADEPEAETPKAEESKAIAKATPKPAEAEPIDPLAYVSVPLRFLRAALSVASKDATRYYLNGVYVCARDRKVQVVGTDGHRLFAGSLEPTGAPLPDWTKEGVIISADGLKSRLALFASDAEDANEATIRVGFAKRARHVELSDPHESMIFRNPPVEGTFPEYDRVIANAAACLDERTHDALEGNSYQGKYVKAVGEMASVLGAEAVTFYPAPDEGANVVTFPAVPGAVMLLMPMRTEALPQQTAALFGPNLKGTLAALKANLTRTEESLRHLPKGSGEANHLEAKAAGLRNKIALVTGAAGPLLSAPAAA